LAFTIVFSQISSMVITFMLIPMLSARIENMDKKTKGLSFILVPFEKLLNWFYKIYEKSLRWCLVNRKKFILIVLAMFVVSVFALTQMGMELMPTSDEGSLTVSISLPKGSKLEDTDELTRVAEERIKEISEVETVFANVGSAGMMSLGSGENNSSIMVTLADDRTKSTDEVCQEVRELLGDMTGATIEVTASSMGMSMSVNELSYQFSSMDEEALEEYVLKAEEVLGQIDGVSETSTSISETQAELKIDVDETKAAMYGLSTTSVANYIKGVLDGTTASQFTEKGSEYDIKIVYPDNYVNDYTKLKTLQVKTATGQWITLGDVADIIVEQGSTTLTRVDQKRVITLSGVLYGTDMNTVNKEFNKAIAEIEMPDGISRYASGVYEMMMEAMMQFSLAILLGILLMYLVMSAQFENMKQPFIILFTVPLSLIGVVLSLVLTNSNLSVLSFIGMLMLVGIIVNNAILLIEFINQLSKERPDLERDEIVVQSGLTRLRPILMTTLTSVIGFFPMAVAGSEMMQPLAVVLLGGLGIGALLTLLVIPVIYAIMDDRTNKRIKRKERRSRINRASEKI
ncbi:MAG: efflux RND transporter permease subunit, partial [Clostridia bacterium]|nr:efflux RND transporter permease subunit [Clostridia bacterium]